MNHYETPAYRIGKAEWRMIVTDSASYGRVTAFEWRLPEQDLYGMHWPAGEWKAETDWPRYDTHDTYYGMPRSLARIYQKHKEAIKAALDDETKPVQVQLFQ